VAIRKLPSGGPGKYVVHGKKVGESMGLDGVPIEDPPDAPPGSPGGRPLESPRGDSAHLQGILVDPAAASNKGASTTNGVVIRVLE